MEDLDVGAADPGDGDGRKLSDRFADKAQRSTVHELAVAQGEWCSFWANAAGADVERR